MKMLMGFITGVALTSQVMNVVNMNARVKAYNNGLEDSQTAVVQYNSGYRGGRFDMLAELVECHHTMDTYIIDEYLNMSRVLANQGELDMTPYPCEE
jgi:hypothetical protein